MLSSKKSTLRNCLLKKITSDVHCIVCSASSSSRYHPQSIVTSEDSIASRFSSLFEYIATKCCNTNLYSSCRTKLVSIRKTKQLLMSLNKYELECLSYVIDSDGGHVGECIFIEKANNNAAPVDHRLHSFDNNCNQLTINDHFDDQIDPSVLLCLLVRWPHMYSHRHLMRSLPWCSKYSSNTVMDIKSQQTICINPYHWSILIPQDIDSYFSNIDLLQSSDAPNGSNKINELNCQYQYYKLQSNMPPPSYSEAFAEVYAAPCLNLNVPKSSEQNCAVNTKWCTIAYWELQNHIGQFYDVIDNTVNVYAQSINQDGLSLEPLFNMNKNAPKLISNTRSKIGVGVSVFRDCKNCVWLYNRSSSSIFVNSYTLCPPSTFTASNIRLSVSAVVKVQPGHLLKAYDHQVGLIIKSAWNSIVIKNDQNHNTVNTNSHETNMFDFGSFRFSFVKGFGVNYVRQNVMQCPCWVEVILDFTN